MSQRIRGQGGHLVFQIGPKNTNLVEDVEFLLPVKFRWILFSGFRGEVENVKVNDGRTTDDGQRMITIVHLSLRLRCTKKKYTHQNIQDKSNAVTCEHPEHWYHNVFCFVYWKYVIFGISSILATVCKNAISDLHNINVVVCYMFFFSKKRYKTANKIEYSYKKDHTSSKRLKTYS